MKKIVNLIFSFGLILYMGMYEANAQCAMCRTTVENNISSGDTSVGAGLNMGILYLFVAPYLLIGIVGFLWYRHAKSKKKFSF